MFLRKLFSSENKLVWVLVDLLIVIVGVYCAFLIQQNAEQRKTAKEREEVLSALKYELEFFRVQLPGRARYSNNQANTWRQMRNSGTYDDFSDWKFIEPQYSFQILELAIDIQNTEILSFDLNQSLQGVYRQVKRVEHAERRITQLGLRYQTIPNQVKEGTIEHATIWQRNYDDFGRLVRTMVLRAENQQLLSDQSSRALDILNAQLKPSSKKKVEEDLIIEYVDELVDSEEEAVVGVNQMFPGFTEEEIRIMYQKATGTFNEEED